MTEPLKVERDRVVRLHYAMKDESGAILESSRDDGAEPLAVLQGRGNLMKGIEEALTGRTAGERFDVTLAPEQAFGLRRDGWTQRVSKKYLPNAARLKPGDVVQLRTKEGSRTVSVLKVGGKVVDVDLNHPQAGRTLTFAIEVVDVREATPEEIAHQHVHGPGGHHHH